MKKALLGLAFVLLATPFAANAQILPPGGDLPVLQAFTVNASTTLGTPLVLNLSGSTTSVDTVLSFATTSDPAIGTLGQITSHGTTNASVTYTPTSTGTETFTYVAVEYDPTNPDPTYSTSTDATVTIDVTAASSTPDTTAPIITAPADQSFATTTFPATPTLTFATATDDTDPSPTITVSTTTFSAGTTTVIWTATDASGNSATTSSQVGVFLNLTTSVDVPSDCTATDTDAVAHSYSAASSTSYLGICAVEAALASSTISSADLSNQFPALGLFVTGLNGVVADSNSQYWALYLNGSFAPFGLTSLGVSAGDSLMLQLHDFSDNNLGSQVTIAINSLIATSTATSSSSTPVAGSNPASSGGGGGGGIAHGLFSVPRALAYLGTVQHADGSFDNDLLTDWAALAFSAQDASGMKAKLTTYLKTASPSLSNVTDYERHAMALEALGINPYTGTATDVITPIVSNLSSASCDASHIASNIFAIFPLLHAGYSTSDSVIQNSVACIVASQASNGSWNDPDTTAAAIQALSLVNSLPNVTSTITKAQTYLKSQEQSTGSFGSTPSTSWALQAIAALGQTESQWSPSGYYPSDYLATMQQTDGGVELNSKDAFTRAWATEFAIPGVLGKTWHSLLSTFARPSTSGSGSNSSNTTATTTAATTTPAVATSTTAIATSTPSAATTTPIVVPLAQTFATVTSTPTPAPTTPSHKPVVTQPTSTIAAATTTATTSPSAQVAAAANAASGIDWRWLFYLILGFLALCGLSWLAYSLIVKRG